MSIFRYYIHTSCVLHTFQGKHASENDLAKQFEVFSLKAYEFDRVLCSFCLDSAWNGLYGVYKEGALGLVLMVTSIPPHAESRRHNHREDALHFS